MSIAHAEDRMRRRFGRWLLLPLAALMLLAGGCSPEDPFIPKTTPTPPRKHGAFLRVVVASPGIASVDVFVDGTVFFQRPEGFLDFNVDNNNARYYPVDSNAHTISFQSAATGSPVASGALSLTAFKYYTAYLHGNATSGYKVLVTADSIETSTVPGKTAKYRVVNLSPDAPAIDIRQDSATAPFVITNLAYGQASAYVYSKEYAFGKGTGLFVYDHNTGATLRAITAPYIPLPPNSTFTLVLTGNSLPRGDDPFLNFSAFQENLFSDDSLYGSVPFTINFSAVRFVNLTGSADSLLDLTFYDPSSEFRENDNFRRNFIGQPETVEGILTLRTDGPQSPYRPYFYLSMLLRTTYPFRIEYHEYFRRATMGGDPIAYRKQDVFVGRQEFAPGVNKRYSVLAYGPYRIPDSATAPNTAHAEVMLDNTAAPPPGMVSVRFFHAAYGAPYESQRLRLRIGGTTTPTALAYGEVPLGSNSIVTASGTPTAEVIDENGNVVAQQSLSKTELKPNKAYTLFLTRGPFGNALYLHALAEDFTP